MAGFWAQEYWVDEYVSGSYWEREARRRPYLILPDSSGTYWSGTYWSPTYFDENYWRSHSDRIVKPEPGDGGPGYWDCYYYDQQYWEWGYWTHCRPAGEEPPPEPPDDERVHSGEVRLALNKGRILTASVDYWQWFLKPKPEPKKQPPPEEDIEVVFEHELQPEPEPAPRKRKVERNWLEEVDLRPTRQDWARFDQRDIADLLALIGYIDQQQGDEQQLVEIAELVDFVASQ